MKYLIALNSALIALAAGIPQLPIASEYQSALAVAVGVAIAFVGTLVGPQAIRGLGTTLKHYDR